MQHLPKKGTPRTTIRSEQPADLDGIRRVNEAAFGRPDEARLVEALREGCGDVVSLVAEANGEIVGHILFSPVTLTTDDGRTVERTGLAPMAVPPAHQRQGIGSALVRAGLEALTARGCPFVIVLGHADYYPRFGFALASHHGIRCQWDGVPDDAFMALILDEVATTGLSGAARYRCEFDDAM